MLNKKGSDNELTALFWVIAILGGCAVGMFFLMYIFYGGPYDVRGIESRLLLNKIASCVSYTGRINTNLILEGNINSNSASFLDFCHLNFNTNQEEEQYYTSITLFKADDLTKQLAVIKKGNEDFLLDCELQQIAKYKNSPNCLTKSFFSFDDKDQKYQIQITAIVKKLEQNVKL